MKVKDVVEKGQFISHGDDEALDREVCGVFCGDLLSWVMAKCEVNQAWITVQTHLNVIAVAALKEVSCLIVVQGSHIPQETLDKAKEEHIAILETPFSAYEAAIACHEIGL